MTKQTIAVIAVLLAMTAIGFVAHFKYNKKNRPPAPVKGLRVLAVDDGIRQPTLTEFLARGTAPPITVTDDWEEFKNSAPTNIRGFNMRQALEERSK